jgi:hypothetical protein
MMNMAKQLQGSGRGGMPDMNAMMKAAGQKPPAAGAPPGGMPPGGGQPDMNAMM